MILLMLPERAVAAEEREVTLTGRNQITVPAAMIRRLGLRPGDKLILDLVEGMIVAQVRPHSYFDAYRGAYRGAWGETAAEVLAFVERQRAAWDECTRGRA